MEFKNIVFAGGGNRCFWQAGFWDSVSREISLVPANVASVSAGSAISCAIFANRIHETLEITKEVMGRNPKNRYLTNLFGPEDVYPHNKLYRSIIQKALDKEAFEYMKKNGPNNHVLLAHIPAWLGPRSAALIGIGAYQLEKYLFKPVHPRLGRKLGFQSEFAVTSDCNTVDELAELILSSSCTPPFTPLMYRQDKPVLDGGMIDNVPVHGIEPYPGPTLVLLSRPYKKLPQMRNRIYVQPSRKVEIDSWDYTSPDKVQKTFELGQQDGNRFLQGLNKLSFLP